MRVRWALSLLGLAVTLGSGAAAQPQDPVIDAENYKVGGRVDAMTGFTALGPDPGNWTVVTIHTLYERPGGRASAPLLPRWVLRKTRGPAGDRQGRRVTVAWTDSGSCPHVGKVLTEMSRLPIPSVTVRGLGPARRTNPPAFDATSYRIWSRASVQGTGDFADVTARASAGPIAAWARSALAVLQPCWRSDQPSM